MQLDKFQELIHDITMKRTIMWDSAVVTTVNSWIHEIQARGESIKDYSVVQSYGQYDYDKGDEKLTASIRVDLVKTSDLEKLSIGKDSREILVKTDSKALQDALKHRDGQLDLLLEELLRTWLGSYEDANFAKDWSLKHGIFGKNALRKATMERFKKWMKGETI